MPPFEYRITEQYPNVYTTQQMFCGSWRFLNEEGYFHHNAGGKFIFTSLTEAETVMNLAKELNGEWYPDWL